MFWLRLRIACQAFAFREGNMILRSLVATVLIGAVGCGNDPKSQSNGSPSDAGRDSAMDASAPEGPRLQPETDAEQAAKDLCALAPWVLASVTSSQLPKEKIRNTVRTDLETFGADKPPICIDDKDSGVDLCDEQPTGTATYAYLYRGESAKESDPVQQVWCKSDNYEDIALIDGVGDTAKGDCRTLHEIVINWAMAQPDINVKRRIAYKASLRERGSEWIAALVETTEREDTLEALSPELYADTKKVYIEQHGTDALPFLTDAFFGNHYCKVIAPAAALAWLKGK